jgi:hypothetical protein
VVPSSATGVGWHHFSEPLRTLRLIFLPHHCAFHGCYLVQSRISFVCTIFFTPFHYVSQVSRCFLAAVMGPNSLPNGVCSGSQPNGLIETPGDKWLIQKFGGTSVGKFPINIVDNVVRRVLFIALCYQSPALTFVRPSLSHGRVVVVCSARSSSSKADGTTNR